MALPTIPIARLVPATCAYALVIASAGFGACFAWKIGSQHSLPLAILTVLFAVALEGIKPIAVCGAFHPRSLGNFIASLIVASVAIAYSLTSELSLVAMSKGDLAASREQVSEAHQRAQEARTRAKQELATLGASRPVGELEALLKASRKERCAVENGTGRWVCPSKAGVQAELGRARRKAELEAILAPVPGQANIPVSSVANADPGSLALSTYLGALGWSVTPERLAKWLLLVPVLALELGSALALVISRGSGEHTKALPKLLDALTEPAQRLVEPSLNHSKAQAILIPPVHGAILDHVRGNGGSIRTTERGLAARLGSSKPTIHRALQELASEGLLILRSSKQGTILCLA